MEKPSPGDELVVRLDLDLVPREVVEDVEQDWLLEPLYQAARERRYDHLIAGRDFERGETDLLGEGHRVEVGSHQQLGHLLVLVLSLLSGFQIPPRVVGLAPQVDIELALVLLLEGALMEEALQRAGVRFRRVIRVQ